MPWLCALPSSRTKSLPLARWSRRFSAYGTENKVSFTIRVWHDPLLFLEEYQAEYDIVYMDIRMPALSGMETARNLRKMDRMVMLIFVTSLAQYALEGYTGRRV